MDSAGWQQIGLVQAMHVSDNHLGHEYKISILTPVLPIISGYLPPISAANVPSFHLTLILVRHCGSLDALCEAAHRLQL